MRFIHWIEKNGSHTPRNVIRRAGTAVVACCLIAANGFPVSAAGSPEDNSPGSPSEIVVVKRSQASAAPENSPKGAAVIRLSGEEPADPSAAPKLIAPLLEASQYRDRMKVTWEDLNPSSSGYVVEVYSGSKLIEEKQFSKYETSYRTDYIPSAGTTYTFKVKALGTEGWSDSSFASAQYNTNTDPLDRPRRLELKVEDEFLQASWEEMESAASYRFLLVDPKGRVLADKTGSSSFYYLDNVPITEKGQYTMYVQARQGGAASPFVKYYRTVESRYEQLKAPTILKTDFLDSHSLEVTWSEVEHAQSYTIRLRTYGSEHTYLSREITTSDTSYTFQNMDFRRDRKYVVEIRSNGERGYARSEVEATTTDYYRS